jgi:putative transposase
MDITYIRLGAGFVYLCAVIDWYSRYILSHRLSITLDSDFCIDAADEAISIYGPPTIFNTDQGVQFTSHGFINLLKSKEVSISMDGCGRALDNVFIERFWRSLKQEKIYRIDLQTVQEAKEAINEYMIFYNDIRLHQSLDYRTPADVHFKRSPVESGKSLLDFPPVPQGQQQQIAL